MIAFLTCAVAAALENVLDAVSQLRPVGLKKVRRDRGERGERSDLERLRERGKDRERDKVWGKDEGTGSTCKQARANVRESGHQKANAKKKKKWKKKKNRDEEEMRKLFFQKKIRL